MAAPRFDACPTVSLVVAARDEAGAIEGLLDALAGQTYPRDHLDVIVVDGRSTDGTPDRVRAWTARTGLAVRLLDNPRQLTPAAFNIGLAAATGDVVVILGARARPAPDFVTASVAALRRSGADAAGGVVETRAPADAGLVARAIGLAQRSPFGVGDARYRYADRVGEVDTVNYGAYRRDVFGRVGGFDEGLQWVEDDELNYRLRAHGGRLLLDPAIRVAYLARPSLRGLWLQRFRWGRAKPIVALRHPGQMRPRHAIPGLFVLALVGTAVLAARGGRWWWPLAGLTAAYAGAALVATARLGARHGWRWELPAVPAAFAAMHTGYGLGTLLGMAERLARRSAPAAIPYPVTV